MRRIILIVCLLNLLFFDKEVLAEEDLSSGNYYLWSCSNLKRGETSRMAFFCNGMIGGLLNGSSMAQQMVSANMATPEEKSFLSSVKDEYQRWEMLERVNTRHSLYCLPSDGIPPSQANDIFLKYLKDHPQTRNKALQFLFIKAMQESFPCS